MVDILLHYFLFYFFIALLFIPKRNERDLVEENKKINGFFSNPILAFCGKCRKEA